MTLPVLPQQPYPQLKDATVCGGEHPTPSSSPSLCLAKPPPCTSCTSVWRLTSSWVGKAIVTREQGAMAWGPRAGDFNGLVPEEHQAQGHSHLQDVAFPLKGQRRRKSLLTESSDNHFSLVFFFFFPLKTKEQKKTWGQVGVVGHAGLPTLGHIA